MRSEKHKHDTVNIVFDLLLAAIHSPNICVISGLFLVLSEGGEACPTWGGWVGVGVGTGEEG